MEEEESDSNDDADDDFDLENYLKKYKKDAEINQYDDVDKDYGRISPRLGGCHRSIRRVSQSVLKEVEQLYFSENKFIAQFSSDYCRQPLSSFSDDALASLKFLSIKIRNFKYQRSTNFPFHITSQ